MNKLLKYSYLNQQTKVNIYLLRRFAHKIIWVVRASSEASSHISVGSLYN